MFKSVFVVPSRMDLQDKEKFLRKLWRKLNESLLVVEGKKDVHALREVGIYTSIIAANGKPERVIGRAIEEAGDRPVSLMFDYDKEGERKTLFYNEMFYNADCNVDMRLHRQLRQLFPVKTIEDLPNAYFDLMETIALQKKARRDFEKAKYD